MKKEEMDERIRKELRLLDKSSHTIKMYLFYNNKLLDYAKKPPHRITFEDIKNYLDDLSLNKNYNASSKSLARSALTFFYEKILKKIPVRDIEIPKREKKLPVVLTKNEIIRIIQAADNLRDGLIVKIMYSCGLRVSECVNLKIEDLDFNDNSGFVRRGKGKKDRIVMLSDRLIQDIKSFIGDRIEGYIFINKSEKNYTTRTFQKIIKRLAKKAQITKKVHSHMFRHAFGTHLVEDGTDITLVQMMMGHSSLDTTKLYVTLSKKALRGVKNLLDSLYEEGSIS